MDPHARRPQPPPRTWRRMSPRPRTYDESDVRIRPNRRGSRPRTKDRPAHEDAIPGFVTGVDRGRYTLIGHGGGGGGRVVGGRGARGGGTKGVLRGGEGALGGDPPGGPGLAGPDRAGRAT